NASVADEDAPACATHSAARFGSSQAITKKKKTKQKNKKTKNRRQHAACLPPAAQNTKAPAKTPATIRAKWLSVAKAPSASPPPARERTHAPPWPPARRARRMRSARAAQCARNNRTEHHTARARRSEHKCTTRRHTTRRLATLTAATETREEQH